MTAITVKRRIVRRTHLQPPETRRRFRELAGSYLTGERAVEFAIEALLFGIIVAISAWPMVAAGNALSELL